MSITMSQENHLAGVRAKVERASKHVVDFYNAKKIFLESYPYVFAHKENTDTGHYVVFIEDIKPVPLELSLIIGDAIHNLRSALDLLACQLVKLSRSNHNCNKLYFPISKGSEEFKKDLEKKEVQLLGKTALDIIEQIQPFQRGKNHELWIIHRLDIQDKHRFLILAPTVINSWQGKSIFAPSLPSLKTRAFNAEASIPSEIVFIPAVGDSLVGIDPSTISEGVDGKIHVNIRFEGDIGFNEPEIIRSKSAFVTLRECVKTVEYTINQFEPLFSK